MVEIINPLFARTLHRNEDLAIVDGKIFVTPITHVSRTITLELSGFDQKFRAKSSVRPTYLECDERDNQQYEGIVVGRRGRSEVASFKAGRASEFLDRLLHREVVPRLRSVAALGYYHEHAIHHGRVALDPAEHLLLEVAMGNLDAALMLMRWHRGKRFDCERTTRGFAPRNDAQVRAICQFVDARDWQSIANNFHAAEEAWARHHGLEGVWRSTPFPFEARVT